MKQNKMREQISNEFIQALKQDTIPWERGWHLMQRPENPITGTTYRGVNAFWLSYQADEKGYSDPRWCTFKQAQEKGWKINKGEKGTQIEFWSMYDTKDKKKLSQKESEKLRKELGQEAFAERVKPISSCYTVFNAQQMSGVPERAVEKVAFEEAELIAKRDVLLNNMGVEFKEGGDRAFYRPSEDSITMPDMAQFKDAYSYMSTFLHEAGHSTGHESRLSRDLTGKFGSPDYAKEELRAEISSAFTSQALGIDNVMEHIDNHKAYIQSWIEVLEKSPNELFSAIRDAEKISDYLIEKGEFHPEEKVKDRVVDGREVPTEQSMDNLEQMLLQGTRKRFERLAPEEKPLIGDEAALEDRMVTMAEYEAELESGIPEQSIVRDGIRIFEKDGEPRFDVSEPVNKFLEEIEQLEQEIKEENQQFQQTLQQEESRFELAGRLHELEEQLQLPEAEQLTQWWGDMAEWEPKEGVSIEQIQERLEKLGENKLSSMATYSVQEAASIRMALKGRKQDIALWEGDTAYEIGKEVMKYLDQGMDIRDVITQKVPEISAVIEKWDNAYIRYEIANVFAHNAEEYDLFMSLKDISEAGALTDVSIDLAKKLYEAGKPLFIAEEDSLTLIKERKDFYSLEEGVSIKTHSVNFINQNFEQLPRVTCIWSEHPSFDDGKVYMVGEFNEMMREADTQWVGKRMEYQKEYGSHDAVHMSDSQVLQQYQPGFAEVRFRVDTPSTGFEEEQYAGDGDGAMTEYLRKAGRGKQAEELEQTIQEERDFLAVQNKLQIIYEADQIQDIPLQELTQNLSPDNRVQDLIRELSKGKAKAIPKSQGMVMEM